MKRQRVMARTALMQRQPIMSFTICATLTGWSANNNYVWMSDVPRFLKQAIGLKPLLHCTSRLLAHDILTTLKAAVVRVWARLSWYITCSSIVSCWNWRCATVLGIWNEMSFKHHRLSHYMAPRDENGHGLGTDLQFHIHVMNFFIQILRTQKHIYASQLQWKVQDSSIGLNQKSSLIHNLWVVNGQGHVYICRG